MTAPDRPLAFADHLRSRRLTLVRACPDDPAPAWLPEAERAILGDRRACPLHDRLTAGEQGYWIRIADAGRSTSAGALTFQIESDLVWTWLAIAPQWRHFGLAGAAVPLIERAAGRIGITQARVLVPVGNGVGLFFWLRLGYRPPSTDTELHQGWRPQEWQGTWMVRPLRESKPKQSRPPR